MSGWPERPVVYEVDTWPWLRDLSEQAGAELTLADVPATAWDAVVAPGVDAVWLMGVWQRSPAGLAIALRDAGLVSAFHAALPDLRPDDVAGSPYCVRGYTVDERLGGDGALAHAREELRRRGARLVLDTCRITSPRIILGSASTRSASSGGARTTSSARRTRGSTSGGRSSRGAATPTSRPGPTSCSWTRSPRRRAARPRTP